MAEWLDSSAVGIVHLVACEADESIPYYEGSNVLFPNEFGGGLVIVLMK